MNGWTMAAAGAGERLELRNLNTSEEEDDDGGWRAGALEAGVEVLFSGLKKEPRRERRLAD